MLFLLNDVVFDLDETCPVSPGDARRFESLGFDYGDFPGHDGLWEMCVKTQHDVTARMALVPRTLEARPGLQ